ncbi:hypothetical protein ARMSODRAFT_730704 [Armillaria solidipes]|uniref:Uncharacterized protein n=1 Tax=Armillaria solidipes TaxID=1076256 RepID=A0A2H3B8X6_9AGAR|nr:hypothetical protein ARMSODRAFT_730704 [Armillaria solidipes]
MAVRERERALFTATNKGPLLLGLLAASLPFACYRFGPSPSSFTPVTTVKQRASLSRKSFKRLELDSQLAFLGRKRAPGGRNQAFQPLRPFQYRRSLKRRLSVVKTGIAGASSPLALANIPSLRSLQKNFLEPVQTLFSCISLIHQYLGSRSRSTVKP